MYARVVTSQVSSDKIDELIRIWRDSAMPAAKQQKGFKSARLLVDRQSGKSIMAVLWETQADAEATGEGSAFGEDQRAKFAGLFTARPVVEHYEVAAEV